MNFSVNAQADEQSVLQQVWPAADQTFWDTMNKLYPIEAYSDPSFINLPFVAPVSHWLGAASDPYFWQYASVFGDAFINCPTYQLSTAFATAGAPVYKLIFDAGRVVHAATMDFLLGASSAAPNPTVAAQMKAYFAAFIVGGDPNTDFAGAAARPAWPAWSNAAGSLPLALNMTNDGVASQADPDFGDKCAWLQSQGEAIRN